MEDVVGQTQAGKEGGIQGGTLSQGYSRSWGVSQSPWVGGGRGCWEAKVGREP